MKIRRGLLILLFSLFSTGLSQDHYKYDVSAERIFVEAVKQFKTDDFISALGSFELLLKKEPAHQRTTAAYIMSGKSLQRLKKYNESSMLLTDFLRMFPESIYQDEAYYTLAIDYIMLQQDEDAVSHLINTIETTSNQQLSANAESLFESQVDEKLGDNFLQMLRQKSKTADVKDLISLKIARRYLAAGVPNRAETLLDEIINQTPKSRYEEKAKMLKEKVSSNVNLKIGVLLPLLKKSMSSSVKTISEEMLDGIIFASDQFRENHKTNSVISLEVRDTEREPKIAVDAIKEFAGSSDIVAVIGPLFSNIAKECAPVAERSMLPMITPTASMDGIAALGKHIFQLSPDNEMRGKAMARYAVEELGFTKLAILASSEQNGKSLAESFSKEAQRLGARILAIESYSKGASDLTDQFLTLRRAGFAIGGKKGDDKNIEVPITTIHGLFIPISDAEEIGIIASQVKYFNIETQILGSNEWHDLQQLESNKRYVSNVIFTSDFYPDENDATYLEFLKSFTSQMKKTPSKYTIIGYDIMKLLLTQIDGGAITRDKLTSVLITNVKKYPGIHSKISFSRSRVNSDMHILKYSNGEIQKVTEISVN
jgi:branched-chain amino acid transport system substrate-binding protein